MVQQDALEKRVTSVLETCVLTIVGHLFVEEIVEEIVPDHVQLIVILLHAIYRVMTRVIVDVYKVVVVSKYRVHLLLVRPQAVIYLECFNPDYFYSILIKIKLNLNSY